MTTPTETVFFFDAVPVDNHATRRIFGVKPCSDFVQTDLSAGISAGLGEPFAPAETTDTEKEIVLPARWAALHSYVLDLAFEMDANFEDCANYAPGMAPIPTVESVDTATDVVSNHIDELKAQPLYRLSSTETPDLEMLPVGRLVLTTIPEGVRFSTIQEKIVTPGGWIWGKAVTAKFLKEVGTAGVEIRPLGFVEIAPVVTEKVEISGMPYYVDGQETIVNSLPLETSVVSGTEVQVAFTQKIHSPTPKWTPPQHFIDRFTQMEVELTNLRAEQETLKAEIAAAAALLPAEDRRPSSASVGSNPRVSTRSGSDLANRRNLASVIGLECSAFDRTTLRKVGTASTEMAAAEF